ncbi:glycosyl transferase [Acidihalobacter ferrooxydans]|uniref:Glycosyl transferase n=1 Tax=Acidihalobacter ferrooxydans TaxID=1765967 RepID=A0A1P8UL83_9GAMM|nr:glycosyl transferase [Acidihalobacter ferrooxydans]
MRSLPYTGTAIAVRKDVFERLGGFDPAYEGCEEYEFMLRTYELLGAESIGHVSGALVTHDPLIESSGRPLEEVLVTVRQAVAEHLQRLGIRAQVEPGSLPATSRVRYLHDAQPLVSIIIPTRNQRDVLQRCLESLLSHTAWPNYEIMVVDNGSDEAEALQYLEGLKALEDELGGRLRVLDYPQSFNYSAMNNLAAAEARGEYLLLLNNDTAALHEDWLDAMMSHAQRPEVGVVGAKLLYPDGKVQHAGVILGMKGPAEHVYIGQDAKLPGHYGRLQLDQNLSAVTGACLLVRKSLFEQVDGLDAKELAVSYSDIDLCLKIGKLGKRIVWTPYAVLMHEGSKSQTGGVEAAPDPVKARRFDAEQAVMYRRWLPEMRADPAYNRCLSLAATDVVPEPDPALRWDPDWRPVPRIITQPADHEGCGEYRIIAPTRALVNAGLVQGEASQRIYSPPELARLRPDALVLQRQIEAHQLEAMERHKRFNDPFCIYEIDDLVTNLPVKSVHKKHLPKDMHKRLRRAVGLCDRLVVATDVLAEAYADLCSDVRVAPNHIEDARWGHLRPRRGVGKRPRVGWAGGISHSGDLDLIAGVIETLKDEVDWVFLGMCPERIRPFVSEFHAPVSLDAYPATLAGLDLDLAVAPLEDVPFNNAKSHLRLLEYGILGYPVVCSDLTPYRGEYPVTRVRNRHRDWVEAIRAHIDDLDATHRAGDRLREYVRAHWLLEHNLDTWLGAWLPDENGRPVRPDKKV